MMYDRARQTHPVSCKPAVAGFNLLLKRIYNLITYLTSWTIGNHEVVTGVSTCDWHG